MIPLQRHFPALVLCTLLCALLCLCLTPEARADGDIGGRTVSELQDAIDGGYTRFTLTDNMSISGGFINGMQGDGMTLVVPEGRTLTITNGIVELYGLELGGTLNLHGGIFRVNGSFTYTAGHIHVFGCWNLFPAEDVLALDYHEIFSFERENGDSTNLLFRADDESEFASAVARINSSLNSEQDKYYFGQIATGQHIDLTSAYVLNHRTEIQLGEDLVITETGSLTYNKVGGGITLNQKVGGNGGAHLVVLGMLGTNSVTVNPDCQLIVPDANSRADMNQLTVGGTVRCEGGVFRVNSRLENKGGTVQVLGDCFNLFPAADIWPDNTDIITYADDSLKTNLLFLVKNADELGAAIDTINTFSDRFYGDLVINGICVLEGDYVLNHHTEVRINAGQGGALIVTEGARFEQVQGTGGNVFLNSNGAVNIPESQNAGLMLVSSLHIEPNCTFRNLGVLETNALDLGGTLRLTENCIFRAKYSLNDNGGTVEVLDDCFNAFPAQAILNDPDLLTYYSDSARTNLLLYAGNAAEFSAAVQTANGMSDRFVADIQVTGLCELEDENILTHRTEIRVNGSMGAILGIKPGASLIYDRCGGNVFLESFGNPENRAIVGVGGELNTNGLSVGTGCWLEVNGGEVKINDNLTAAEGARVINDGQIHIMSNGQAIISGALENNSFFEMLKRNDSDISPHLIIDGGSVSGGGRIGVKDTGDTDSYFQGLDLGFYSKVQDDNGTQYIPYVIDIFLPEGLTAIQSEAFAGDTFGAVYIPAGVTTIASDAFKDMTGLTIYGASGSAAETFAGEKGFTFVAVS